MFLICFNESAGRCFGVMWLSVQFFNPFFHFPFYQFFDRIE